MNAVVPFVLQVRTEGDVVRFQLAPPPDGNGEIVVLGTASAAVMLADPGKSEAGRSQLFEDLLAAYRGHLTRLLKAEGLNPSPWQEFPPAQGNA